MTRGKVICPLLLIIFVSVAQSQNLNGRDFANDSEKAFEVLVDSAEYYSSIKNWKDAERTTINALRLKPANKSNWLLWANLAEIRQNLDDSEGALEAYNIGLSLQPNSINMLSGRAALLISEKKMEDALTDLDILLKNDSTLEWPRMIRGMVLMELKNTTEAEKDFEYLKKNYPENTQGYNGLASIAIQNGEIDKAITLYSESLKIMPDETIYFYKVTLLADNGRLPEASETLREAMKAFPRNGNLYLLRAYLHRLNYQNEEAEIALKLAKEYGADQTLIDRMKL